MLAVLVALIDARSDQDRVTGPKEYCPRKIRSLGILIHECGRVIVCSRRRSVWSRANHFYSINDSLVQAIVFQISAVRADFPDDGNFLVSCRVLAASAWHMACSTIGCSLAILWVEELGHGHDFTKAPGRVLLHGQ